MAQGLIQTEETGSGGLPEDGSSLQLTQVTNICVQGQYAPAVSSDSILYNNHFYNNNTDDSMSDNSVLAAWQATVD